MRKIANDEVVARFPLEDLADRVATHCGLDSVLNIGYVDSEAGSGPTVNNVVKVGLANHAKEAEVLHALNLAHNGNNLIAPLFERLQIIAVDLYGEFAFDTADSLFDVVRDGLGEAP